MTRALMAAAFSLMVFVAALASPLTALAHESAWDHNWANTFEVSIDKGGLYLRCHTTSYVWRNKGRVCMYCSQHKIWYNPYSVGSGVRIKARDVSSCEAPKHVKVTLTSSTLGLTVTHSASCVDAQNTSC